MDMLKDDQIVRAQLADWRKLAQGLHARYLVADFGTGARFVSTVGEAGDAVGHHPRVTIGDGYVDLRLVSPDAIYRTDDGTELVVEWVTQQDVDLARRISGIAAEHGLDADPASVSVMELGLDTQHSETIARSGRRCSPGTPSPRVMAHPATRSATPGAAFPTSGSATARTRPSGSTSRSTSHRRRPSNGSPQRSPRVRPSSTTVSPRRSPCSPTRTATGASSASPCLPTRPSSDRGTLRIE